MSHWSPFMRNLRDRRDNSGSCWRRGLHKSARVCLYPASKLWRLKKQGLMFWCFSHLPGRLSCFRRSSNPPPHQHTSLNPSSPFTECLSPEVTHSLPTHIALVEASHVTTTTVWSQGWGAGSIVFSVVWERRDNISKQGIICDSDAHMSLILHCSDVRQKMKSHVISLKGNQMNKKKMIYYSDLKFILKWVNWFSVSGQAWLWVHNIPPEVNSYSMHFKEKDFVLLWPVHSEKMTITVCWAIFKKNQVSKVF